MVSPSVTIMTSKRAFSERFPEYRSWLLDELAATLPSEATGTAPLRALRGASLARLEAMHGEALEASLRALV